MKGLSITTRALTRAMERIISKILFQSLLSSTQKLQIKDEDMWHQRAFEYPFNLWKCDIILYNVYLSRRRIESSAFSTRYS